MYLKDIIEENGGVDNIMFIAPFQPLHVVPMLGIGYTSSNDEEFNLPAVIVEDRYKVEDGYKITLQCQMDGFGEHHYYQSDLKSLIDGGIVYMYKKVILI